ncbi:CBS domain-containing protein, partial [Waterburya agarophytonicola K14]
TCYFLYCKWVLRTGFSMTYDPYTAEINTPLPAVIDEMTKQKIGAAIIVRSDRLAGIVTIIDICQAFSEILKGEFSYVS